MTKRQIAKQIETALVKIHCRGYTTMSEDEIKKVPIEDLKAALIHIREAQLILKIK